MLIRTMNGTLTHNVLGLYAGWDFSTKALKMYQCSTLHKCSLKVLLPTLRKTLVIGCFSRSVRKFKINKQLNKQNMYNYGLVKFLQVKKLKSNEAINAYLSYKNITEFNAKNHNRVNDFLDKIQKL